MNQHCLWLIPKLITVRESKYFYFITKDGQQLPEDGYQVSSGICASSILNKGYHRLSVIQFIFHYLFYIVLENCCDEYLVYLIQT